jgi:predicted RNase H-like HicB family nuclease
MDRKTQSEEDIKLWKEDEYWIISHEPTGVTTQGENRYHALLMLADALRGYYDVDIDLVDMSKDVFILSEDQKEFIESLDADVDDLSDTEE